MRVRVKVIPRAKKSEIITLDKGCLKVKLTAPPIKNKANIELIEVLSKFYGVKKSAIKILQGQHSREKVIEVRAQM